MTLAFYLFSSTNTIRSFGLRLFVVNNFDFMLPPSSHRPIEFHCSPYKHFIIYSCPVDTASFTVKNFMPERERERSEQTTAMASSDAGTSSGSEYQVFLNFRGPDTRVGFTDFLFRSLTGVGICVFRDDEELRVGERISGALLRAIDNSKIYIPIFSQTYASSPWCLRELAHIVANTLKSEDNKVILPIFFDVEPNDVKLKTKLYFEAIYNLMNERNLPEEEVDAWRKALKAVDEVKGWEVKKYKG